MFVYMCVTMYLWTLVCKCIWVYMDIFVCMCVLSEQPHKCVPVCPMLCALVLTGLGMEGAEDTRLAGSRRESDRRALPQPPAPGAYFSACRSCEPVNSSYINSCCLHTYCRERRSWPWWGLVPYQSCSTSPHRTRREGRGDRLQPHPRANPCGRGAPASLFQGVWSPDAPPGPLAE